MPKIDKDEKRNGYQRLAHLQICTRQAEDNQDEMIIEGKAVCFNEETVLWRDGDTEYKEIIAREAFDECDMRDCFLKYNHCDSIMAVARVKNGTLKIDVREDGVYITARLAKTTAGRDLYELVKRGDIDKMSFAFTIREESYDRDSHTWTVRKIDKLYDVAAVTVPAYENTSLYARRRKDVEALRVMEVEASKRVLEKQKLKLKLEIQKYI